MKDVIRIIDSCAGKSFADASLDLESFVASLDKSRIMSMILRAGMIPERFKRDSTEEKLFSKASDIIVARAFEFLGFDAYVSRQRGDSADVVANSRFFDYGLVADAKAFRLSRTAKNQKDFKIRALQDWRENERLDFSVLIAPYYQYPIQTSQIYRQALHSNVCLFSWELLYLLLENDFCEQKVRDLSSIWSFSSYRAQTTFVSDSKKSFLSDFSDHIVKTLGVSSDSWLSVLELFRKTIVAQGAFEIKNLNNEVEKIRNLTREEAIRRLIETSNYQNSIKTIEAFIKKIERIE